MYWRFAGMDDRYYRHPVVGVDGKLWERPKISIDGTLALARLEYLLEWLSNFVA